MVHKSRYRKVVIVIVLIALLPIFFNAPPASTGSRTVDGNPADWTGTAPAIAHTDAESNGEWIYKGAADDCRTDSGMTAEADLTEVRLTTDGTYLYFLFRLKDIQTTSEVHIGVGIDTDQEATDTAFNWIGDQSNLTIGRAFMYAERVLSFHVAGGGTQAIEWFAGGSWYGISGSQISISDANDVVEARVPLNDLNGLTSTSDFILTVATFQNNPGWNNDMDTTDNFYMTDAVDVMSTPGQTGNAWSRDLNDGNVYFGWWIQLRGSTDAPTAIVWDRLYHSSCDQLTAYGCAAGDHPAVQYVPSAGQSARFLSARRYSTDGTLAPGGVTDVYVFDDESADAYFMAHTGDVTDDTTYPRLRYYYSSEQFVNADKVDSWTGTWNGTTELTYDIFRATIPAQNPGNVYYAFAARDESGDRYVCRSGFGSGPENRGWIKQWVRDGQCTNHDYAYTVLDDDITGPTIENVTFTDNGANDQVCATVYDANTRSGDNDSGVQSVQVRYSATRSQVADGSGGTTAAMSNSGGNTYCANSLNFTDPTYYRVEATNNDYDNSRAADRESSASSTYCTGGSCAGGAGASQNNDVWWNEVYHDTRAAYYRTPFGAVPTGQSIQIRLRAAQGDLTDAALVVYNAEGGTQWLVQGTPESSDGTYSYYKFTIPAQNSARILYYKFRLRDDPENDYSSDCDWYVDNYAHNAYDHEDRYENGTGMMVNGLSGNPCSSSADGYANNSFNITVYDQAAYTNHLDAWAKNAVIYQILPDRFRDGDPTNVDDWPYTDVYGTPQHIHATWNEAVDDPRVAGTYYQKWSADFFGGDLQGVMDELDYLQAQGVTALYLNPIFASPSNHGYDTSDYLKINPRYGTNALFQTLATEAENRGIKIILDGVFNHTGSDSRYFDRYNRWDADGNPSTSANTTGACESQSSTYDALYTFNTGTTGPCTGRTDGKQQYDSWWGYDTLPLLNENTAVKNLIFDHSNDNTPANHVIQYWTSQGADGWRFDVADEVSHSFWQDFRTRVKNDDNLNGPLYSEVWFEATPWLFGDQLDATMNYRYRKAVLGFLIDTTWTDNDNNGDQTMWALSPAEFDYVLNSIREDYPTEAWYAMMNLMDSHDTNRALFVLREKSSSLADAIAKLKLMAALQFTYPGAPTIYYGDEVGLGAQDYGGYGTWGAGKTVGGITQDDPYNRAPYPWPDASGSLPSGLPNTALRDTYRILALTRNNYDVLRTGDVTTLAANDTTKVYAYARTDSNGAPTCAIAIFNRATSANNVTLSGLPAACSGALEDALNGGADYTISSGSLTVTNLPALTAAVLVPAFDNPNTTDTVASLPPVSVSAESAVASLANGGNTAINATVRDVAGQTMPAGVTVNFEIVSGSGTLSSATANTNSSGVASVTYTAPSSGQHTVVIRAKITAPSGVTYNGETTIFVGYQANVVARVTSLATIGPYTVDQSGPTQVNLWARKVGRGEPTLTLARYDKNPRSGKTDTGNTYYDVHLSSTANVDSLTVRFYYYSDDNESNNKLYWYNTGSGWTQVTGATLNTTGIGGYLEFTFTSTSTPNFTALSGGEFGGGYGGMPSEPTAVTLASFTATPQDAAILVAWETASELDNVGFNLYRSQSPQGPWAQINNTLIPPQHPGEVIGGVYEWLNTDVQPGVTYYYQLEDIDIQGVSAFHGPVMATARAATAKSTVYLPLVMLNP